MPDWFDAQDVLAQELPQDVANLACDLTKVIIGKPPMIEVSLFPALTGCKGNKKGGNSGQQPVNARLVQLTIIGKATNDRSFTLSVLV